MTSTRRHFVQALGSAAALGALHPLSAFAQALDQVKIMYGFPAGSAGDSVARRVAEKLGGTAYSKNPGFVENKPGAGGRIAVETLKNSAADGSVLTLAPVSAMAVYPHIYPKLSYKPEDVTPVSIGAIMHHGLAVGPAVPAEVKTLADFLKWAKANTDKAMYGSPGAGTMPHLLGALLGIRASVDLKHVPYRGTVPSITDLVGGQIASAVNPSGDYLQYMKTGRVRVLATSGKKRSPLLPNLPTIAESGYPEFDGSFWLLLAAPKGVPEDVQKRFLAVMDKAIRAPEQQEKVKMVDIEMVGSTPAEAQAKVKELSAKWGALVQQIHLKAD